MKAGLQTSVSATWNIENQRFCERNKNAIISVSCSFQLLARCDEFTEQVTNISEVIRHSRSICSRDFGFIFSAGFGRRGLWWKRIWLFGDGFHGRLVNWNLPRRRVPTGPLLFDDEEYMLYTVLFGGGPWFNRDQICKVLLLNDYMSDYWLPGGVPVGVLQSAFWRDHLACRCGDWFITSRTPHCVVSVSFACCAMHGFIRVNTCISINLTKYGMLLFRTTGEQMYLERFNAMPSATIEGWWERDMVEDDPSCGLNPFSLA